MNVVKNHEKFINDMESYENGLVLSASNFIQSQGMNESTALSYRNILLRLRRQMKHQPVFDVTGIDTMTDAQLRLAIAQLEKHHLSCIGLVYNIPDPFIGLEFKHNSWYEKLMSPEEFSVNDDDECQLCFSQSLSTDNPGHGNSVLYDCVKCTGYLTCSTCVKYQIGGYTNTVDGGLVCSICKSVSHYIDGIDEYRAAIQPLVDDLFEFYPRISNKQKQTTKETELFKRILQSKILKVTEDTRNNLLSIDNPPEYLSLYLSRVEVRRKEFCEKIPLKKLTPYKIEKERKRLGYDKLYLPLGPLSKLVIPRNVFMEWYFYLSKIHS
jgi:hypothetical protein